MHHVPRIFDLGKQSPKKEQTSSPKSKLYRTNAAKNFTFTPPASSSPSASSSPAHRTTSVDVAREVDRTSFRIHGNYSEVNSVIQSLGLSGPEDFEIPKAAWEAMKSRSPPDVILKPKNDYYGYTDVPDESHSGEDVQKFGGSSPSKIEAVVPVRGVGNGGIKGDRPPLLTPPPAMAFPVFDDTCSTWEILKGMSPDGDFIPNFSCVVECDGEISDTENTIRLREIISGVSSFTTTRDDDASSTYTEYLSIFSPNRGCKLNITHWEKGDLLGSGSFGTVYKGMSCEGVFFAVKEVSLLEQGSQGKQCIYYLEQEIELLSQFEHGNIVRYLGTDKDDSKLYIFLELVTQGSLADLYRKYNFRDSHASAYTRQILLGLKYLHEKQVVHRDIKCANILVASTGAVKLADFGLAKVTKLNDLKSCKGTAFWMAPEVVNHMNRGYGPAADIWSLGCTVLEMLTGHVPYFPLEFMQALFMIGKGEPPPIPTYLSRNAKDFIHLCLCVNPNDRPTAAELLEHPFVQRPLYAAAGPESPMPSRYEEFHL